MNGDRVREHGPILDVDSLEVSVGRGANQKRIVTDASFRLHGGEILAIVGESGSGKSVSMLGLTGLLPRGSARVSGGTARFHGQDLLAIGPKELRCIRGSRISMIFQDPLSALDPLMTVGAQIVEAIRIHDKSVDRSTVWRRAVENLERVGIPDPSSAARRYPHEFSGGMRQRVMIVIAMVNDPEILIADEPTTALDVTIQDEILRLIVEMRDRTDMAVVLITHDLGVVARVADSVVTMYAGRTVEAGRASAVLRAPRHHYTGGLLDSVPPLERAVPRLRAIPGTPPPVGAAPHGCAFHPRCERGSGEPVCASQVPERLDSGRGSFVACHFPATRTG